jgi:hypothetical protein
MISHEEISYEKYAPKIIKQYKEISQHSTKAGKYPAWKFHDISQDKYAAKKHEI